MREVHSMNPEIPARITTTDPPAISGGRAAARDGIQPQVLSETDDFFYQVPKLAGFVGSGIYWWRNTGPRASVHQATTVTAGRMTLVIRDANGAQVYSRSLGDPGIFVSANGVAGRWTIQVVYEEASGSVSFRAKRKG